MLSFINPPFSRQGKRAFKFPSINRDYPAPDIIVNAPERGTIIPLSSMAGFNAETDGMAFTIRFSNTNWGHAAYERYLVVGSGNSNFFFQKRNSEGILRWGYVSKGTIVIVDQMKIDYLHDGMFTLGASIREGRIDICINGFVVGYQTENVLLPALTDADSVCVGRDFNGTQPANSTVIFDDVKIWSHGLTTTELENATYESEPLLDATYDENLWTIIKAGQSNSVGAGAAVKPAGLTYNNADRMYMITKDLTLRPYADPYTTRTYGNVLSAFNDTGGYSGAGVMIDSLAAKYRNKKFAVMPCNRGGTGLVHTPSQGSWGDVSAPAASNGNAKRASHFALATYLSMTVARQMGNVLAIEWYQGESDGLNAAATTAEQYKAALTDLFDRWRLALPPIRLVVNLSAQPSSGYNNWPVIRQALSEFSYANTGKIDAVDLPVIPSEQFHLSGEGQYQLDLLAAAKLKTMI